MAVNRTMGILSIAVVVGLVGAARGGLVVFDLSYEFSGAETPAGSPPYLRATFADTASGEVTLTLENLLQGPGEFLGSDGWLFNYDPSLSLGLLVIAPTDGETGNVSTESDSFKADGDGCFDIRFSWDDNVFIGGETAVFTLTSSEGGFNAMSFDFLSAPGNQGRGGIGPLLTAAHVQGVFHPSGPPGNTDGSGWVTIPAPGAALLGVIGLGLVGWIRRRIS